MYNGHCILWQCVYRSLFSAARHCQGQFNPWTVFTICKRVTGVHDQRYMVQTRWQQERNENIQKVLVPFKHQPILQKAIPPLFLRNLLGLWASHDIILSRPFEGLKVKKNLIKILLRVMAEQINTPTFRQWMDYLDTGSQACQSWLSIPPFIPSLYQLHTPSLAQRHLSEDLHLEICLQKFTTAFVTCLPLLSILITIVSTISKIAFTLIFLNHMSHALRWNLFVCFPLWTVAAERQV